MTSKERISKILNFRTPDRIGIHDIFLDSTIESWKTDGLPSDVPPGDYFDFDFEVFDLEQTLLKGLSQTQKSEKFICLSFSEPFQRLCDIFGREETLRRLARYPEKFKTDLIHEADRILDSLHGVLQKGIRFDGIWAWGDLAYNKGLFFSPDSYKRLLLPLHKKIFKFLNSKDIFVLFHSDGMISDLIPYLLEAGVRAFHPLEEASGMDIDKLLKDFKDDMVFMGCVNTQKLLREKSYASSLRRKIDMLKKNCSYIYHSDCPIMPEVSFKDYSLAMDMIRECGAY